MIHFERFTLDNGLRVLLHEDHGTPLVAVNILYDVGARDEDPEHTGFAHLFEHLMFGGSVNIPSYDTPLQIAGGENNAFTNNDITNYYLTLPAQNLETALWLESDRMLSLAFNEKSLDVQRNVVIEEFKQRYLNQPYGDVWLKLRPLAYTQHPYQWATIGKEVSHIEQATLEQVKSFFSAWYRPDNAILCLAGAINTTEALELVKKWFGPIPAGVSKTRELPAEPTQTIQRRLVLQRDVPASHLYLAFHCCARRDSEFYATDLLSDILSRGKSSRLYQTLVKDQQLFTEIGAYMLGDFDKSLFVVEGKLVHGVDVDKAEEAIFTELDRLVHGISERELDKVKHKAEASFRFSEMGVASKALNLCYFELLGDANESNLQPERYNAVTETEIIQVAKSILRPENCSILHYISTQHA
ncbi:MAG: insulinase family protein [Sphingobacteriales bacterium]|jgi:predicted Zn-dependent peptidase|nr:insulinase family protein [Sphingobacteriales bacterium]